MSNTVQYATRSTSCLSRLSFRASAFASFINLCPVHGKKRSYSEFVERRQDLPLDADINLFGGSRSPGEDISKSSGTNGTGKKEALKQLRAIKESSALNSRPYLQKPARRHGRYWDSASTQSSKERTIRAPSPNDASRTRVPSAASSVIDTSYIRKHLDLPHHEDYPSAPAKLFRATKMIEEMHNFAQKLQTAKLELSTAFRPGHQATFRSTATLKSQTKVLGVAVGEGRSKKAAAEASCLYLLATLHKNGVLKEVYTQDDALDQTIIREESKSIEEIYDYAARFALIPEFSYRTVTRPLRAKAKTLIEVRIMLPEQHIDVVARGPDLVAAEIKAALKFKEAADHYQAQHGDVIITVRDRSVLNFSNARNFHEFYRMKNPAKSIKIEIQLTNKLPKSRGSQGPFEAQAYLDDQPLGSPVIADTKKKADAIAYLVGAVTLLQQDPALQQTFEKALTRLSISGEILTPVRPLPVKIDPDAVLIMRQTLTQVRAAGLDDEKKALEAEHKITNTYASVAQRLLTPEEKERKNTALRDIQSRLDNAPELAELREKRAQLPMSQYRRQVLNLVNGNTYSVIVGATGSGKTTQVPQILLEDAILRNHGADCNIICTQPRRIAATSVAQRVADERHEELRRTVGYAVRFDSKRPRVGGSITYCTTGILLQQLQASPEENLDSISHVVIDEVHERDIIIDFLMIVLKRSIASRRAAGRRIPKVILMSATIDSQLFAKYFQSVEQDGSTIDCPSLSVPGRTFPVKEMYLNDIQEQMVAAHGNRVQQFIEQDPLSREFLAYERDLQKPSSSEEGTLVQTMQVASIDWKGEKLVQQSDSTPYERQDGLVPINLIAATIAHICKTTEGGAILVFLPGYDEMRRVSDALIRTGPLDINFNNLKSYRISLLHSSVPAAEQKEVFDVLPASCRRIILSTNIAETSVTIPEVQHIVDSGKLRERRYDQIRRVTSLECAWISKSNAKQRAGRAGRVRNGNYYALYTRERFSALRTIGLPEMLRSDLQEICLDVKTQPVKTDIRNFLSQAIEPPSPASVDASVRNLQDLEALTPDEDLTPLGRLLAALPVHPSLGKMIVLGIIFRCLDPMVVLGASQAERSLFTTPLEKRNEARAAHLRYVEGTSSDHFAMLNAFLQLRSLELKQGFHKMRNLAFQEYMHSTAYSSIKGTCLQIEEILIEAGLIPYQPEFERFEGEIGPPSLNKNSSNIALIKALALGGLFPNLAVCQGFFFRTANERSAMIHPSSINYNTNSRRSRSEPSISERYSTYDEDPITSHGSLIAYSTMARAVDATRTYLKDVSPVTPLMALLLGGRLRTDLERPRILTMDDWLPFRFHTDIYTMRLMVEFRKGLDRMLTRSFVDLESFRKTRAAAKGIPQERRLAESKGTLPQQDIALNRFNRDLASAFSKKEDTGQVASLADDEIRDAFARGVVDVINRDTYKPMPWRVRSDTGESMPAETRAADLLGQF